MLVIANAYGRRNLTYYRRRIVSSAWDFVIIGVLPLGAVGFLAWIFIKSLGNAPWTQRWSLIGIVIAGLIVMLAALCHALHVLPDRPGKRGQYPPAGRTALTARSLLAAGA